MSKDYLHIPCSIPWLLVMIPSAILLGITRVHTHDGGLTTPRAIPQDGRIQNTTFHTFCSLKFPMRHRSALLR